MTARRTIEVRLIVQVSGDVTVATLRAAARKRLGTITQYVSVPKGTLPDPDTIRDGTIHWSTAEVKQRASRRGAGA